jgi:flagellar protein FliO/FliZ
VTDFPALLKLPLALALVIGLILLAGALFRRFGPFAGALPTRRAAKRLGLVATQVIDNKRRIVLIRRDGVEHLLLIGGANDVLIEQGIIPPAEAQEAIAAKADTQARGTAQDPEMSSQPDSLDSVIATLRAEPPFGQPPSSQSLDNDRQEPTFAPRRSQ